MKDCIYPDWEGGYIVSKHKFDKDGFCIICGYKKEEYDERLHKSNHTHGNYDSCNADMGDTDGEQVA